MGTRRLRLFLVAVAVLLQVFAGAGQASADFPWSDPPIEPPVLPIP